MNWKKLLGDEMYEDVKRYAGKMKVPILTLVRLSLKEYIDKEWF